MGSSEGELFFSLSMVRMWNQLEFLVTNLLANLQTDHFYPKDGQMKKSNYPIQISILGYRKQKGGESFMKLLHIGVDGYWATLYEVLCVRKWNFWRKEQELDKTA